MANENILSLRYVGKLMNSLFSEMRKNVAERSFWLSVLRSQKEVGVDIPDVEIEKLKKAKTNVNLGRIKEIEKERRHDIKAKIEAFLEVSGAAEIIHKPLTSRDLTDNVEQSNIKAAAMTIFGKYVSVLRHFLDKAYEYRFIALAARTHHQPAQVTLLGRRFAMWAEELLFHLLSFEAFIRHYPLRGIKGPIGTQLDILTLLNGDEEKVQKFEKYVAKDLGFSEILDCPGQVYPRSLDYALLSHLALLASPCESFAKTMRLMAGLELVTEGFKEGQVGSTAMPHKQNTRTSERICGFSSLIKMYNGGASRISGDQWEEGDVSCSVVRRVIIPDAFFASDGLCEATLTVLNEMGAYPMIIEKELDRYLPFLATTEILNLAGRMGIGRETAHAVIKKHAVQAALDMKFHGAKGNYLTKNLAADPAFADKGVTYDMISELLVDHSLFIGNAYKQINAVVKKAQTLLERYPEEAKYEPEEIL